MASCTTAAEYDAKIVKPYKYIALMSISERVNVAMYGLVIVPVEWIYVRNRIKRVHPRQVQQRSLLAKTLNLDFVV